MVTEYPKKRLSGLVEKKPGDIALNQVKQHMAGDLLDIAPFKNKQRRDRQNNESEYIAKATFHCPESPSEKQSERL